uniref:C-type lectin domain-containing protein n=1 Tax=Astyanax mexicanus TaxID=7994 RepID=A0A3B1JPG5_ASTMX
MVCVYILRGTGEINIQVIAFLEVLCGRDRRCCNSLRLDVGERFVLVFQLMTWTEAQRYCREHHTDLASVRNEAENQKLRLMINDYYDGYYGAAWIGLYRTRLWSDNSSSSFSYWKTGQPDNAGQSEHCTAVSFRDYWRWRDEDCYQTFPFFCSDSK